MKMNSNKTPSQKVLARQEKIKAVALELFLTKGYQETSLSDIIKLSGGSYSNIYNSFKSKEGLFFEILDDICKKHFHLIHSKTQEIKNSNLKEILISFGLAFIEIFILYKSAFRVYKYTFSQNRNFVIIPCVGFYM